MDVRMTVKKNNLSHAAAMTKTATTRRVNTIRRFVRDRAQAYVAYDTGELHDSIVLTATGVAATAGHAAPQEYGWRYSPGTPYMRPAMADARAELDRFFSGFEAEIAGGGR